MDTRSWRTTLVILICGSIVVLLATGLRISFGLFLKPMSSQFGWGREIFALAMAIQNLLWGVFQPFVGAVADRWGSGRVVATGGILYASGLYIMSIAVSPFQLYLGAGLCIGLGLSSAGLGVVLGAVGRVARPDQRSLALGIVTADRHRSRLCGSTPCGSHGAGISNALWLEQGLSTPWHLHPAHGTPGSGVQGAE
jgi:MFS family permease